MSCTIHHGDCLDVLKTMDENSVDSIVTDPPYGLSFMGKAWDHSVPSAEVWAECLRVLKPGGHLLAFAGTRTQHRMAVNIEVAGFEIRDMIAWVYGSGFPKSLNVGKAIDKARNEDLQPAADVAKWLRQQMTRRGVSRANVSAHFEAANIAQQWTTHWINGAVKPRVPTVEQWAELKAWLKLPSDMDAEVWRLNGRKGKPGDAFAEREVLGETRVGAQSESTGRYGAWGDGITPTSPATPEAKKWDGWGTALKPALEPITVARKPFKGTVAGNVLTHGTGAINVDGCRVGTEDDTGRKTGALFSGMNKPGGIVGGETTTHPQGRWPANFIHDGSDEVVGLFPETTSGGGDKHGRKSSSFCASSAARFFYCAKASKKDRDEGCDDMPARDGGHYAQDEWSRQNMGNTPDAKREPRRNHHPTVKPTDLMRYLVRLVTPPNGTVLDPFMGSGSTGKGATLEGFDFIGIELDADYIKIARARIDAVDPDNVLS